MALKEWIEKRKIEWEEKPKWNRWAIYTILAVSPVLFYVQGKKHDQNEAEKEGVKAAAKEAALRKAQAAQSGGQGDADPFSARNVLPKNNRNQGLEVLASKIDSIVGKSDKALTATEANTTQLKIILDRVNNLEARQSASSARSAGTAGLSKPDGAPKLSDSLPDAGAAGSGAVGANAGSDFGSGVTADPQPSAPTVPSAKVWESDVVSTGKSKDGNGQIISVPIFSGIESVMLTGINARSNAAGGQAAGSVVSANNVGAPFVTKVKGWAIGPNRTKVSELNDCFIGGSGVGILSTGRANVISSKISCVDKHGVIFEGNIKAFGVDLDGNQGISGRVVTKQGAILAKATLAGVASGLGTALSPSGVNGYNQNFSSGQQGIQYANPSLVAQQAIGGGISSATQQLSRFYLDYAKEMFPVIEVDAGSRITWILQETLDLFPKTK